MKPKGRALVVDDENYIQEILKSTLEEDGFECIAVGDADSALAALASASFDIALCDIRMPGRQGTELLKEIKAGCPEVIVIMVTALQSTYTAIESWRLGAYDYIVKPFDLDQVLVSANRALDKRHLENTNREYQRYLAQKADEHAEETRRLFYSITQVFIHLLDKRTPFNEGHALRVAERTRYVAHALKMTEDGVRKVYLAALLHDIGTILVEDVLLNKRGTLTAEEHRRIQERTAMADDFIKPILNDDEVVKAIRHKRERYDGTGYPSHLKGNLIPLGARVIAVVEAFDAMTMGRPYRLPQLPEKALEELVRCAGTQFDPHVVTIFSELYEKVFRNLTQSSAEQS